MDLIENYPSGGTAFIGFFAVDASLSGRGIGTRIIAGCLKTFFEQGFKKARLAVDYGNCQSKAFWTENGFTFTGEEYPNGFSSYRGRVCQDTFCGFSKLNDLSVQKPPKTSCLQMS